MKADIPSYTTVMREIRRRAQLVGALEAGNLSLMFDATRIESMLLQVRIITELIAMGSLAANKQQFEGFRTKFHKHWHPDKILKEVETLNPNFYPVPMKVWTSQRPGVAVEMVNIQSGFLTSEELVEIHGRCGNLLHAQNPYGKSADYDEFASLVPEWMKKIEALLGCHMVRLAESQVSYLVQMNHGSGDQVVMYTLDSLRK